MVDSPREKLPAKPAPGYPLLVLLHTLDDRFKVCEDGGYLLGWNTNFIPKRITSESVLEWLNLGIRTVQALENWVNIGAPFSVQDDYKTLVHDAYRLVRCLPVNATTQRYARRLEGSLNLVQTHNELEAIRSWLQDIMQPTRAEIVPDVGKPKKSRPRPTLAESVDTTPATQSSSVEKQIDQGTTCGKTPFEPDARNPEGIEHQIVKNLRFHNAMREAKLTLYADLFPWFGAAIREIIGESADTLVKRDGPHDDNLARNAACDTYSQWTGSGDVRISAIVERANNEWRQLTGLPAGLEEVEEWRATAAAAGILPTEFDCADVKYVISMVRAWAISKRAQNHRQVGSPLLPQGPPVEKLALGVVEKEQASSQVAIPTVPESKPTTTPGEVRGKVIADSTPSATTRADNPVGDGTPDEESECQEAAETSDGGRPRQSVRWEYWGVGLDIDRFLLFKKRGNTWKYHGTIEVQNGRCSLLLKTLIESNGGLGQADAIKALQVCEEYRGIGTEKIRNGPLKQTLKHLRNDIGARIATARKQASIKNTDCIRFDKSLKRYIAAFATGIVDQDEKTKRPVFHRTDIPA